AVEFLNCYSNDQHGGNSPCAPQLREKLVNHGFLHANGELNPSYPLNYQEKPLTRIMLGRAYWDLDITADTTGYPGRPTATATNASVTLSTYRNPVTGTAGTMQSTGLWAPQHGQVTLTGGEPASITVALVDDLTGRTQHEVALKRPARVEKHFKHDGSSTTFAVPFGGLIYVTPQDSSDLQGNTTYAFSGVHKASWWKDGAWQHPLNLDVPLAEVDSGQVIYTTPVNNVTGADVADFVTKMNRFAEGASDFYGRDETAASGTHRRFTGAHLPGHSHRFVNDVQISIGAAHSGYPVQSSGYRPSATTIPTAPDNDWLLWHEIGHNLASAPLNVAGATEVANNVLALYMQELRPAPNDKMARIELDIQKAPTLLQNNAGHVWSEGDAGVRLVMFGQLKLWAEQQFDLSRWYDAGQVPSVFGEDQGWNFYQLMHRKARGDNVGASSKNYCAAEPGLSDGDRLMLCASYVSGYDLSSFFSAWNPGETKVAYPSGDVSYSGGITAAGLSTLASLNLPEPAQKPEAIASL
ncbi:MAG: SslE/AcfD family lipoprotein zinc metalloprotease, partial [Aeromonas sp.]